MPALVEDISAATREQEVETWSDAAILARYPRARDGSEQADEGFFDVAADGAAAIAARGVLLGKERRRFKAVTAELIWVDPIAGIPTVTLIDPELAVSAPGIACRVELDLESEITTFEVLV